MSNVKRLMGQIKIILLLLSSDIEITIYVRHTVATTGFPFPCVGYFTLPGIDSSFENVHRIKIRL